MNTMTAAKESIASKLSTAREAHSRAAYDFATSKDGRDQAKARTRVADLATQIDGFQRELQTIEAAIAHADVLAAEERKLAEEQARQVAAAERKLALQRARSAMEQTTRTAAEIDKLIDALGEEYRAWRAQFDAASGAIEALVGSSPSLTGVGRDGLRMEIRNRLCATGVLIDQFALTTELLERRVSGVAQTYAHPFLHAAHAALNDSEVEQ